MADVQHPPITYSSDLRAVRWDELKATLAADDFDNGRTPGEYRRSFEASFAVVFALAQVDGERRVVGKARALSDGVCNAYVIDVWTWSPYRRRGVATEMMRRLEAKLEGQHVYLFTDEHVRFYEKLGYRRQAVGLSKIAGRWLGRGMEM